jgi:hypothetical protein
MKKLIFILLILFACQKEEVQPPVIKHNVVFYSTGSVHKITGTMGTFVIKANSQIHYPDCDTFSDGGTGFRVLTMKSGKYDITISTNSGNVIRQITVYDWKCNVFDVANCYGWQ